MAMENGPFKDVFPIENGGFSIAMLVYRSVFDFQFGHGTQSHGGLFGR